MGNEFITKEGKKVSIGEPFSANATYTHNGMTTNFIFESSNLTISQAEMLVKKEILKEFRLMDKENNIKIPTFNDAISLISIWLTDTPSKKETVREFLDVIPNYAGFSIVLRAFAVLMDAKYPDHINNANVDKYYTIDMTNGRVCEILKNKIKNFRNFGAFRNLEDIKIVTKILRPYIKTLWSDE